MVSCTNMYPLLLLLFSCACISDGQPGEHVEPTETEHLKVEKFGAAWNEYEVAFAATLGHGVGPFNEAVILVYDYVFVNEGGAYNPTTGIFTAPVKGVYFFMVSAFHDSYMSMDLKLFKNEQQMVTIYSEPQSGRYESAPISASNSISLILEEGDQVYVKLHENSSVYDDENNHNTFVGHLLFPLYY